MHLPHFAAASVALVIAAPAIAQDADIRVAPPADWVVESEPMAVPEDATGLMFVRRIDSQVHLTESGQQTFNGQMIRILHSQALSMGNVAIAWNPAAGSPTVHRLLIHRDGEVIDVLKDTTFEILRREDQLEQAILDGTLTATLRVPDLRVGDDLELAYTIPSHDPTLGSTSLGFLAIADSPPEGRIRLRLTWEDGQEPYVQIPNGLKPLEQRQDRMIVIGGDNIAAQAVPKDAPPRYDFNRMAQFSDFADWQAVSARFHEMFSKSSTLSPDSPIRKEAQRIAAAHEGQRAQAEAALDLVQQQVRYVYVGLNGGNFQPASAEETWARRYGDCKGKTTLLLALLGELGIDAQAVLVSNAGLDDGLDERIASPTSFDHVLVRATIEGRQYWLDGTLPHVADMREEPPTTYRFVLPLSQQGEDLEPVDWQPFALPQEMSLYELDARGGFEEPGPIVVTSIKRGYEGYGEYLGLSALTANQLEQQLRNALTGGSGWNTVDEVSYRYDRETQASILTIRGTSEHDWEDDGDGAYSMSLPGGGFSPPSRRRRPQDQNPDAPYYNSPDFTCHVTTVRLPEDTKLKSWSYNTVFFQRYFGRTYYRMMERRDDRTLRMVRGFRTEDTEISPAIAARDNQRIDDFDNSKANIYYEPGQDAKRSGIFRPVPATFEDVWQGPQAPCLPGPTAYIEVEGNDPAHPDAVQVIPLRKVEDKEDAPPALRISPMRRPPEDESSEDESSEE